MQLSPFSISLELKVSFCYKDVLPTHIRELGRGIIKMKTIDIITRFGCILLVSAASVTLSCSPIWACSIPVFRYALERWSADDYEVIVFYQDNLSIEEQTMVDKLKKASSNSNSHANIIVRTVNLSESPDESMRKLWEAQSSSELPWMVVRYPRFSRVLEDAWSGHFTAAAVEMLLDSPTRKEIARRILEGEAAVWVLLESGIQQQDEAAARLLETQLKKMEETLEISVPEEDGILDMAYTLTNSDKPVKFSMVRLSRNDPSEQIFVQMLLHTELDLKTVSKPMAFPIFGRGRVLYALVGDGINEDNIEMACSFLVGWCSCEVKELNPGVDILMSVNWDKQYEQIPLITGYSEHTTAKNENSGTLKRNLLIVALVQILIVAIVTCVVLWRKRHENQE